ncbi:MAG: YfhO family protein [Flavobacteriaceae bacterium]|nr:YfhO family protein [Flavobacteriaceae bacterium]
MNTFTRSSLFILAALMVFAAIALLYNSPVISGQKAVSQPDIINYKGSAQEMYDYRQQTGEETYWSNAMFGGMPTYQTGAKYSGHWIKKLDETLRFLPRPADYMFLMFSGFFMLGLVLFRNWKYAFLGACLFAMCSYFFQLYEAGHNSKVHAIAYFAPLTAGVILIYRKKYILGFILTALFMALQLVANHPQMTYYLGLALVIYVVLQAIESVKTKQTKSFVISSAVALFAVILGLGMNASSALATYQYGQSSTRGNNDISLFQNQNQTGLNKDYITHWSYGKLETLNLFIPNFMGGSSVSPPEYKQHTQASLSRAQSPEEYEYFAGIVDYLPTYWGQQPFTGGPAYQGAVVILLFILGMFLVKGKMKWWLVLATILSIFLAWGKNMMWLTDIFIDYFPMYDKFRAVSSILVIAEFTMPLLAVWAVYAFFTDSSLNVEYKKKVLIYAGGGTVVLLLIFWMFGKSLFGFSNDFDQQLPPYLREGLIKDRWELFQKDSLRSLMFVILALGLLFAFIFNKIKQKEIVIFGLALLTIIDLWGVGKRYFNDENYISKQYVDNPFPTELGERLHTEAQANPILMPIAYRVQKNKLLSDLKKEDPSYYRVFDFAGNPFNDASTSYFLPSIGGYHGAKLQNYQNIIDIYLAQDTVLQKSLGIARKEQQILAMLNTKYYIVNGQRGEELIPNPTAMGNAWFVKDMVSVADANEAIVSIGKVNLQNEAVVLQKDGFKTQFHKDSLSNIELVSYAPNRLEYKSQNSGEGFAVFSEIYYKDGWNAYIDGQPAEIFQTNYVLRGLKIPAGNHQIVFEFKPQIIETGKMLTLGSNLIFILICLGGLFALWKNNPNISPKKTL